jgi:peptidoglycan hydrolase-like protein with peptidoglycan-binding domain
MRGGNAVAGVLSCIAIALMEIAVGASLAHAAGIATEAQDVEASSALVREIQFMLLRIGMEPGPIDGIVGPQTLSAVRKFQAKSGLPISDLVNEGKISGVFLARLRGDASRAILGGEKGPSAPPEVTPPSPVAVAPAQPPAPPPDPFAACTFNPGDFRIGAVEYTPDKFLQVGFDGSTTRAVASLKDRLDEARQLAENLGGSALAEVQRQARVLNYFNCRLKIEQASEGKK